MLHSPCPMIVTVHDLHVLTRRSERLRGGGVHLRLRHLALQRATHVIVPTEVIAGEAVAELGLEHERVVVIPPAPDPAAGTGTGIDPVSRAAPAVPAWTWRMPGARPGGSTRRPSRDPSARASAGSPSAAPRGISRPPRREG